MKRLILFFAVSVSANFAICQATVPNNIRNPIAFLGWNGLGPNSGSLDIRNDFNQPIHFGTNGSFRMMIDGGAASGLASQSAGQVAISSNLPAGFAPQARLHIHHNIFSLGSTVAPFIRFTISAI